MKNNLTELVFILDRSGSMAGLESDTVGGFNAMIAKQKKEEGEALVTTVLFDGVSERLHDRLPLEKVPQLTDKDYTVRGCTALFDARGQTIGQIESIHKYAREEDRAAHTLFMITTDGMENASHRFGADEVKRMIERHKEADGWQFSYIGAKIDGITAAATVGIGAERAVNYHADKKGTKVVYETLAKAVGCVRRNAKLKNDWGAAIQEDYESR